MAKSVAGIFLLAVALSFTWAAERSYYEGEHERRRNTPPELTPESAVRTWSASSNGQPPGARLFSFIPVTATVSLNADDNNAHSSLSLGASLDGISLAESNSYNHPAGYNNDGASVSVSKSATISAGLLGISTAGAEAYGNGNNAKVNSHSLSFGQATATSFGKVKDGRVTTGVASSIGASQSSAQTERRVGRPTLTVSKPHVGIPTLNIEAHRSCREQVPTIRVYTRPPGYRLPPQPTRLSIGYRERRSHNSMVRNARKSTDLRVGVNSADSSYGFSAGDSASQINANPLDLAISSTSRPIRTSRRYTSSHAQSVASFSHRNVYGRTRNGASSGYVSGDIFAEGHSEHITSQY